MYMTMEEFRAIEKVLCNQGHHYMPEGEHFDNLPKDMQEAIVAAEVAMIHIFQRDKKEKKEKEN